MQHASGYVAGHRALHRTFRLVAASLPLAVWAAHAGPDLDASFADNGRLFIDYTDVYEAVTALGLQRDGRILVGRDEHLFGIGKDDYSVLRLNRDGSLDASFGRAGRAGGDLSGLKAGTSVVLEQLDGKIVVAGPAQGLFGVVRYEADGARDSSFGDDGVVLLDLGGTLGIEGTTQGIHAVLQQTDARLVVAGTTADHWEGTGDMAFVRLEPDGSLDRSFGNEGTLVLDFAGGEYADGINALIRQPDGKLVGAGFAADATGSRNFAVVRLTVDGALDPEFDGDGRLTIAFTGSESRATAIALDPSDDLVLAGTTRCRIALARVHPDGSLDSSFADAGTTRVSPGPCATTSTSSLALEPSGAIVVVGTAYHDGLLAGDLFVARLNPDGQLDAGFGVNGFEIVEMGRDGEAANAEGYYDSAKLVRQTDGALIVAASDAFDYDFGGYFFMVARLIPQGSHAGLIGLARRWLLVDESAGTVEITVRRTGGSTGAVGVDYGVADGDATGGADFTATGGTLFWADGEASAKTVSISIANDGESEEFESFTLALSNASGGASLAAQRQVIAIADDEPAPPSSNPPSSNPPTISVGNGGGGAMDIALLVVVALLFLLVTLHRRGSDVRRAS